MLWGVKLQKQNLHKIFLFLENKKVWKSWEERKIRPQSVLEELVTKRKGYHNLRGPQQNVKVFRGLSSGISICTFCLITLRFPTHKKKGISDTSQNDKK